MSKEKFIATVDGSYTTNSPSIYLGAGVFENEIIAGAKVNMPLRIMARHGLVRNQCQQRKTKAPVKSRCIEKSTIEQVMTSPVAKQVGRELVRGVFECCLVLLQEGQPGGDIRAIRLCPEFLFYHFCKN